MRDSRQTCRGLDDLRVPPRRHENGRDACEVSGAVALRVLLPALQIGRAGLECVVGAVSRAQRQSLERQSVGEALVVVGRAGIRQDLARVRDAPCRPRRAPARCARAHCAQRTRSAVPRCPRDSSTAAGPPPSHPGGMRLPTASSSIQPIVSASPTRAAHSDAMRWASARPRRGRPARRGPLDMFEYSMASARVAVLGEDPAALAHVLDRHRGHRDRRVPSRAGRATALPASAFSLSRSISVRKSNPCLRATRDEHSR